MRQWLADPAKMCLQHRLGEHVEAHMFLGSMRRGFSLDGYYENGLCFGPKALLYRHQKLARTFDGHQSPLMMPSEWPQYPNITITKRAVSRSIEDLVSRCKLCERLHGVA